MSRRDDFEYDNPYDAARVSDFMVNAVIGRWRVKHFTVTMRDFELSQVQAMHRAGDDEMKRAALLKRCIPPGDYISLQRRATPQERKDDEGIDLVNEGYVPVMSDTPDEIEGHHHAIENAHGRVLINGLGLGCLVSALLAKPEVTHIDVVEIDADVMRITAPYYLDNPRVEIHRGDCMSMDWSSDVRWDYAWHDIWSQISSRNLDPRTAEHRISYGMLFAKYSTHADLQGAWAYEEALAMREAEEASRAEQKEWEDVFWAADIDTKVEMTFEESVRDHIKMPDGRSAFRRGEVPQELLDFFEEHQPGMKEAIRKRVSDPSFTREAFEASRLASDLEPLGNPNNGNVRPENANAQT